MDGSIFPLAYPFIHQGIEVPGGEFLAGMAVLSPEDMLQGPFLTSESGDPCGGVEEKHLLVFSSMGLGEGPVKQHEASLDMG